MADSNTDSTTDVAATLAQPPHPEKRTPKPAGRCHLTELPPELRNRIWELAVIEEDSVAISPSHKRGRPPLYRLPTIVRVSQQFRSETLALFLTQNTFHFNDNAVEYYGDEHRFRLGVLVWHLEKLRRVEIDCCGNGCVIRVTLADERTRFEVVSLEFCQCRRGGSRYGDQDEEGICADAERDCEGWYE